MTAKPTDTRPTHLTGERGNRCCHCGRAATDLVDVYQYVGGHGLIWQGPYCQDSRACWVRWDDKARGQPAGHTSVGQRIVRRERMVSDV